MVSTYTIPAAPQPATRTTTKVDIIDVEEKEALLTAPDVLCGVTPVLAAVEKPVVEGELVVLETEDVEVV